MKKKNRSMKKKKLSIIGVILATMFAISYFLMLTLLLWEDSPANGIRCNCCNYCECNSCMLFQSNRTKATLLQKHNKPDSKEESFQKPASDLSESTSSSIVSSVTQDKEASYKEKERIAIANIAIDLYTSEAWNGKTFVMEGHEISLSDEGILRVDGFIVRDAKLPHYMSLDYPAGTEDFINQIFIFEDGTYRIEKNTLVKYSHGKQIPLTGGFLNWDGMDTDNYRPFDIAYYYNEEYDKLFIVASSVPYDLSSKELKDNVGLYLYVVPDRSKSEIKFLKQMTNLVCDESGLLIIDTSGTIWKYGEQNGMPMMFKPNNPRLISKFPTYFEEGGFEIDWNFTFADGFINERCEFPEGTFTHPVTTTPWRSLSDLD